MTQKDKVDRNALKRQKSKNQHFLKSDKGRSIAYFYYQQNLSFVNQAEKRLIDEIDTLLSKAATFNKRYDKYEHKIEAELYEDFLYFGTRARYVWHTLDKREFTPFANGFLHSHVSLRKSQIEVLSEDLIEMTARLRITKREIEDGLYFSISELAKADVFYDFLESGKHFLDEGY